MDCEELRDKWPSYLNGEVCKEEQSKIVEHVSLCHHCRENLNLAGWIFSLREFKTTTPPLRVAVSQENRWRYVRSLLVAAIIVIACFIIFSVENKEIDNGVEVLSIESSTTYISENEHRTIYYHYYLGEHNE